MEDLKQSPEALYNQARSYLQEDQVVFSYEQGIPCLKATANLGHAKAQYNLGICLLQGMRINHTKRHIDILN